MYGGFNEFGSLVLPDEDRGGPGGGRNPASSPANPAQRAAHPAVADDLRPNEDEELGALDVPSVRENAAPSPVSFEPRDPAAPPLLPLAHQAAEQNGLSACDRNRAPHLALRHGWCERLCRRGLRDRADLLLDVEQHIAIGVDAWRDAQDHTRVAVIDRVDDRLLPVSTVADPVDTGT